MTWTASDEEDKKANIAFLNQFGPFRETKPKTPQKDNATALYRHYDNAGRLLYVGISKCAITRLAAHANEAEWYRRIATVTIDWFSTRAAAEIAERAAIRTENPLANRQRYGVPFANTVHKPHLKKSQGVWFAHEWRLDRGYRLGCGQTPAEAVRDASDCPWLLQMELTGAAKHPNP